MNNSTLEVRKGCYQPLKVTVPNIPESITKAYFSIKETSSTPDVSGICFLEGTIVSAGSGFVSVNFLFEPDTLSSADDGGEYTWYFKVIGSSGRCYAPVSAQGPIVVIEAGIISTS